MLNGRTPARFIDARGLEYKFYVFTPMLDETSHISINIVYPRQEDKFGSYTYEKGFCQPIVNGKINWLAYGGPDGRKTLLSKEAINYAERLIHLLPFA